MKTIHKVWLSILISVFASLGLYAAGQQITSLTQTVSDGDIITAGYYNAINGLLGWSKVDGKMCKFVTGKIVCIDDVPTGWGVTQPWETIMRKRLYVPTWTTADEYVTEWNAMIDETFNKRIEFPDVKWNQAMIDELTNTWYSTCKINSWNYGLNPHNKVSVDWCGQFICAIWKEHGMWSYTVDHCWNNTGLTCPKAKFMISCMY